MFTWICPQCGREVPPAYDECPDCAARARGETPAAPGGQPAAPAGAPPSPAPPAAVPPAVVPPPEASGGTPRVAPPPARPPAPAPRPASTAHTLGLSILFALAFVGLGAGIYWLVNYVRDRGQATQPVPLENPAAAKGKAKPHPLQRYIEVTGVRFIQDAKKKTEARFLVVNHSPDDITDLGGTVTIWGRTQKSDEESVGTFSFKLGNLGPFAAKEMAAPMNTKLRVYELPDWQNVTAEVQLTSP